jgi:hypothetical protein
VSAGEVALLPDRAGFHTFRGEDFHDVIAVHAASAEEGVLPARQSLAGTTAASPAGPPPPQRLRIWPWLLTLALGLLSAEWLTFHRRWTV